MMRFFRLFEVHDSMTKIYLMELLTTLKMKVNENVTKHVHNFKSLLKQLFITKNPMKDEKIMFALMQNMPPSYESFLISVRSQTLTLQTLITYLKQRIFVEKFKGANKITQATPTYFCYYFCYYFLGNIFRIFLKNY